MITREEVIYAYRLLFGREPDNETVINHYATEVNDIQQLRSLFINSTEFQCSIAKILAPRPPRLHFNGPPMEVELNASPDKLQALLDKTSRQWQHLGETEPHWSVLTHESYFQETFHLNRTAFYASGESEVKMLDATLARAGISRVNLSRCLELGCGVGRVTAALASRFEQVIGVDISTAHLQVADTYLKEKHISNVQYHHLNTIEEIKNIGHFDFLYSRIVLQHNPPPVMQRILMDLFNQLNPGGIAWIQIPTYKAGYHFSMDNYLEIDNSTNMEMHFFPQAALLDLIKQQNCKVLEIREDDAIGVSLTSISNTLLLQKNSL